MACRADYEELDRLGISVKGAIVIARYGGRWRGIKPQGRRRARRRRLPDLFRSARRRLRGGEVFPEGPYRPRDGVQRGSVMDMPVYPGDPLTPGVGATQDAKRLPIDRAQTLTKIPVMPISYGDAQPLLAALDGPGGAARLARRPADYLPRGPGPGESASESLKFNWDIKPLYDVIARIPGSPIRTSGSSAATITTRG